MKNLLLFVSDYPNGKGEAFLEEEIMYLENSFSKIIIVQSENFDETTNFNRLYKPKNSSIENLGKILNDKHYLIRLKDFRFVLIELCHLIFFQKRYPYFSLIKQIGYYWKQGIKKSLAIHGLITRYDLNLNDTLVYSYWCDESALALAFLRKKNKQLKIISRVHGWDLYFERHEENYLPFRKFILDQCSQVLPISKSGYDYILSRLLVHDKKKLYISRLGVGNLKMNKAYRFDFEVNRELKIITISHINPVKSLEVLVDSLTKISEFNVSWTHVGYGYEPYQTNFINYVKTKLGGISNITFDLKGNISRDDVLKLLENEELDVIINCSKTEGIPVSLMEACSASIPAIAFDVGGVSEVIKNGFNGILLENNNKVERLRKAITKFYSMSSSEKRNMSHNAKKIWQQKFDAVLNYKSLTNQFSDLFKIK